MKGTSTSPLPWAPSDSYLIGWSFLSFTPFSSKLIRFVWMRRHQTLSTNFNRKQCVRHAIQCAPCEVSAFDLMLWQSATTSTARLVSCEIHVFGNYVGSCQSHVRAFLTSSHTNDVCLRSSDVSRCRFGDERERKLKHTVNVERSERLKINYYIPFSIWPFANVNPSIITCSRRRISFGNTR